MSSFRQEIKKEIASKIFEIKVKNQTQEIEKNELGLRLLKFFEYEQDPEFIQWFTKFCHNKKWQKERKKGDER